MSQIDCDCDANCLLIDDSDCACKCHFLKRKPKTAAAAAAMPPKKNIVRVASDDDDDEQQTIQQMKKAAAAAAAAAAKKNVKTAAADVYDEDEDDDYSDDPEDAEAVTGDEEDDMDVEGAASDDDGAEEEEEQEAKPVKRAKAAVAPVKKRITAKSLIDDAAECSDDDENGGGGDDDDDQQKELDEDDDGTGNLKGFVDDEVRYDSDVAEQERPAAHKDAAKVRRLHNKRARDDDDAEVDFIKKNVLKKTMAAASAAKAGEDAAFERAKAQAKQAAMAKAKKPVMPDEDADDLAASLSGDRESTSKASKAKQAPSQKKANDVESDEHTGSSGGVQGAYKLYDAFDHGGRKFVITYIPPAKQFKDAFAYLAKNKQVPYEAVCTCALVPDGVPLGKMRQFLEKAVRDNPQIARSSGKDRAFWHCIVPTGESLRAGKKPRLFADTNGDFRSWAATFDTSVKMEIKKTMMRLNRNGMPNLDVHGEGSAMPTYRIMRHGSTVTAPVNKELKKRQDKVKKGEDTDDEDAKQNVVQADDGADHDGDAAQQHEDDDHDDEPPAEKPAAKKAKANNGAAVRRDPAGDHAHESMADIAHAIQAATKAFVDMAAQFTATYKDAMGDMKSVTGKIFSATEAMSRSGAAICNSAQLIVASQTPQSRPPTPVKESKPAAAAAAAATRPPTPVKEATKKDEPKAATAPKLLSAAREVAAKASESAAQDGDREATPKKATPVAAKASPAAPAVVTENGRMMPKNTQPTLTSSFNRNTVASSNSVGKMGPPAATSAPASSGGSSILRRTSSAAVAAADAATQDVLDELKDSGAATKSDTGASTVAASSAAASSSHADYMDEDDAMFG